MPTGTRASTAKAAFNHVMDNVLGKDDSSPLKMALIKAGCDDMHALNMATDQLIDDLVHDKSQTETDVPVPPFQRALVTVFLNYVAHRNNTGNPIGSDWTAVTPEEFDNYRTSPQCQTRSVNTGASTSAGNTTYSSSSSSKPCTLVDLFKRGIKRDATQFPVLKDEKYHEDWKRKFINEARIQDVFEVLDPNYKPSNTEERDLLAKKREFVYGVFEKTIFTNNGKDVVRSHEKDVDATEVWNKLQTLHNQSTKAKIESSTLLSYITSARLGNGEWNGTAEAFILNWKNQVRLCEKQVDPSDHFSPGQKRTMLENSVHNIKELRGVKTAADLDVAKGGTAITYDQYMALLIAAAQSYDKTFKPKQNGKRTVYMHDVFDTFDDDSPQLQPDDDADPFDIDSPVTLIQANVHDRNRRNPLPNRRSVFMQRDK